MALDLLRRTPAPAAEQPIGTLLADPEHPLSAVLASLHSNCFVADLSLNLVWMNRKAERTVAALAPAVRSAFGVDLHAVLGGSIHRFHKDPARIERILADPAALPRVAEFTFGGVTLSTQINAVTDGRGRRLGYVVLWEDVTSRQEDYIAFDTSMTRLAEVSGHIVAASTAGNESAASVAESVERLRSSVDGVARATGDVTPLVGEAVGAVEQARRTLETLQRTSDEIGEFLGLITSVSDQTRLLALNATIEAARAGSAGRGFAVVAEEVKSLAGSTAGSITDIESRISAIQTAAQASAEALRRIAGLVDEVSRAQDRIVVEVAQQADETARIATEASRIAAETGRTAQEAGAIDDAVREVTERTARIRR